VKQENTYSIYAGLSKDAEQEVMRVDEVSDAWNRCCCTPYHPFRLEVRQYIPMPGDGTNSDYAHLSDDVRNDFARYNMYRKLLFMHFCKAVNRVINSCWVYVFRRSMISKF
jgi:hypothetical protein